MDFRFERIQRHLENCMLQSGVFERNVEGAQLFDTDIVRRSAADWLVIAAGISESEASNCLASHRRDRATVPIQVVPQGQASMLLLVRPYPADAPVPRGKFVTEFSVDVGAIEFHQGCYIRIDNIDTPVIQQIRWELDPVLGHKAPGEPWLKDWRSIVGCNPAHPPSHWHVNSPPVQQPGRRGKHRVIVPPELRMAAGLPNPLLLLLSIANWLKSI